jgi:hypothetical protein
VQGGEVDPSVNAVGPVGCPAGRPSEVARGAGAAAADDNPLGLCHRAIHGGPRGCRALPKASHDKLHRFEIVDLEALSRGVTFDWVDRARAKNIDLGFEPSDWPLAIDGVPLLLRELLNNLIDNEIGRASCRERVS